MDIILQSTITCPNCGHKKEETMPTDACQHFYECENCKAIVVCIAVTGLFLVLQYNKTKNAVDKLEATSSERMQISLDI